MGTKEKLEELADLKEKQEILRNKLDDQKQAMIDSVYTPEIREAVRAIEAEFEPKYDVVNRLQPRIEELTEEIRKDVLASSETIKGSRLQMVFAKGRTSWETADLKHHITKLLATVNNAVANFKVIMDGITDDKIKLALVRFGLDMADIQKEAGEIAACEKTGDPSTSLRKVA